MTRPHPCPTNIANYLDQAACIINSLSIDLEALLHEQQLPLDTLLTLAELSSDAHKALRWLELAGAKTKPREI